MNKEIVKNQAETIARVFEKHTSHKMAHSTAHKYENECVLTVCNGRKLKTDNYPNNCSYIRVTDRFENEIGYWISDEWAEAPEEVMGAIIGALNGGPTIELPLFASQKENKVKQMKKSLSHSEMEDIIQNKTIGEVFLDFSLDSFTAGQEFKLLL